MKIYNKRFRGAPFKIEMSDITSERRFDDSLSESLYYQVRKASINYIYSRTPVTRPLKENEALFELAGFRVIGVDLNIQFNLSG